MNPFELSDRAEILNRRTAQTLCEAISRTLGRKTFCFSSSLGTAHGNRCLVVLRDRRAIEIFGTDDVTYRIPFGARVKVAATAVKVELRSIVHNRPNHKFIRWHFVVDADADIGARSHGNRPPSLPPRKIAWLTHEDDVLRLTQVMRLEVAVCDG